MAHRRSASGCTNGTGMGARAAAGSPRLDVRRLLDYLCDIVVAVPSLAPVLACSVLPRLTLLARLADRGGAARPGRQPILEKVLGAFAEAMPEVRALEALQCCCVLPAPGLHEISRGCWTSRGCRHTELPGVRLCVYLGRCMWRSVTAMPIRHGLASLRGMPSWQLVMSRIASCIMWRLLASTVWCATEKSIRLARDREPVLSMHHV